MARSDRNLALDILLGAAAGAAGTWVMDQLTTYLYENEPEEARKREDDARGGKTAYAIAADKAASALGRELTEEQAGKVASGIHWGTGIMGGAVYGALRNLLPLGVGSGVAFGVAQYLLIDEGANVALGLTPGPREFPWQAHARGLAGHLVLGAVIESVFDAIDLAD